MSLDTRGSPAWAGIDPSETAWEEVGEGFPRVGGDRPPKMVFSQENSVGSPAWAGIDLLNRQRHPRHQRFPRVGGDRPPLYRQTANIFAVPPRGRG